MQSLAYRHARQRRRRCAVLRCALLSALLAGAAVPLGPAVAAELPASFEATYRISAKGLVVARMTRRFVSDTGTFSVLDETRTTGLAALLRRDSVSEESRGRLEDALMLPVRYRYERRRKRGTREKQLSFDWENARVMDELSKAEWQVELAAETFDKLAYQVAIMRDLAAGKRTLSYRIADDQRIKTYELATLATETVETPSGSFVALKLARTNAGGDRRTTFWCAEALGFLAVRVEHEDDGTVTVAELVGYAAADGAAPASDEAEAASGNAGRRGDDGQERLSKNSIKRSAGT